MRAVCAADPDQRPAVVHVSPDPSGRGGMAAVVRGLLGGPLAQRYALRSIVTHRAGSAPVRVAVAVRGGAQLCLWCVRNPQGLVHVHTAVRGSLYRKALAVLAARAMGRSVLLHVHAGPGDIDAFAAGLGPARRGLFNAALRRAQSIVSVSEASARALSAAFALDGVGVIANAAPAGPNDPEPAPANTALFLGGFEDPAKGGTDFVDALPALLHAAPQLSVELAGPGHPPAQLQRLDRQRVRWSGWLNPEAKRKALTTAGIVILPSRSEGLPIVLLEAMAHGRAIVATRVGGIPELLDDGVDGVLVAPGDPGALVMAISQLTRDPGRVARLGAAARSRVAELGEETVVARIDSIYRALLER